VTVHEPVELSVEECLALLRSNDVGRVAFTTPSGPRIVPVNYAMHDETIVFRTTPYSELGSHGPKSKVAFEADQLNYAKHEGWSVVAVGTAEVVEDPDEVHRIKVGWDPEPWAAGARHLYLRLRWRDITGRRLGHE